LITLVVLNVLIFHQFHDHSFFLTLLFLLIVLLIVKLTEYFINVPTFLLQKFSSLVVIYILKLGCYIKNVVFPLLSLRFLFLLPFKICSLLSLKFLNILHIPLLLFLLFWFFLLLDQLSLYFIKPFSSLFGIHFLLVSLWLNLFLSLFNVINLLIQSKFDLIFL
jgi:hypothetical protein